MSANLVPQESATAIDPVDFLMVAARTNYAAFITAVHRPRYRHSPFSAEVCRAVDQFVDDLIAGKRPVLILKAPPQHGKLLHHDTPMLTANRGWITHGELRVGDLVYRPDGTTTRVIALSGEQACDAVVTFSDGAELVTHSRHEWQLHRTWLNGRTTRVMETREITAKGVWSGKRGQRGSRANFQLPAVSPLGGASAPLPLHPYALGAWLGDGTRTKPAITLQPGDRATVEAIEACGYPVTRTNIHRTTGALTVTFASLRAPLRALGLLNPTYATKGGWVPKSIPDVYFTASVAQRLDLLAGLLDTDGYVYPQNGRVTFSTCEPELARDVARLVSTFGWRVTTTWFEPKMSTSGIQGHKPVAQICWQHDLPIPCRLVRKRDAQLLDRLGRKRNVTDVRYGAFGVGRCIQVEHDDGMYLAGDTLVPTHNSSLVSRCLAPYLFGRLRPYLPATYIAGVSYALGLARGFTREVKGIMADPLYRAIFPATSMVGFRGISTSGEFELPSADPRLPSGYRGVGVGGVLTGKPVHVLLIDDSVKNSQEALSPVVQEAREAWFDSVGQTRMQELSGTILIGTPWSANDLLARVQRKFQGSPRLRVLSFPALNEPGESGYREDLPQGALVPHLHSVEKLRDMKQHISSFWWAAMFQQVPMAEFGAIFKREGLRYYRRAELPAQFVQIVISVDATFKDGQASDFVAAGVWAKSADNRVWLLGKRREKLAFMATAGAIVDLKRAHPRATRVLIEDAANGAALVDMLKKHIPGLVGVPPLGSKEARAHAVSWAWDNGQVMLPHPDEDPSIAAWVDEITSFPDSPSGHDDTVDCMTIALHELCLRSPIAAMITADVLRMARQ